MNVFPVATQAQTGTAYFPRCLTCCTPVQYRKRERAEPAVKGAAV
jgi:hypothetical protein